VIEFERIVCGVDSSPQSLEGVRQALEIAPPDARALAVLAWNTAEVTLAGIHRAAVGRDLRAKAEAVLAATKERFPQVETRLLEGEEKSQLLAVADEENADLMSVGSHGTSGRVAGVLLGSIATAVIHEAPCSVLIARERSPAESRRTIVHATDGSDGAIEAARVAAAIAIRTDANVLSVHVGDGDQGAAILEEAAKVVAGAGAEGATRLEAGAAHTRLIEIAEEVGAALVIEGARGLSGLKSLGSVSERVAHQAPCSVLIVRPEAARSETR
jgi:nucleotide-binding universal stress UspA family protein